MKPFAPVLMLLWAVSQAHAQVPVAEVQRQAVEQAFTDQHKLTGSWNYPSTLGLHYTSQYALLLKLFARSEILHDLSVQTNFSETVWKRNVMNARLPDGSWPALHNSANVAVRQNQEGDLNASIYHYWALKSYGVATTEDFMLQASRWIISKGGVEKSNLYTKIFLALFGEYTWDVIPNIPYLLFAENMPSNVRSFGQWIEPHLRPIAYLKAHSVVKILGPEFRLDELWANRAALGKWRAKRPLKEMTRSHFLSLDTPHIDKLISLQRPRGSFGGYTAATLFSLLAIEHYASSVRLAHAKADRAIRRAFHFVESMYFQTCATCGPSYMQGIYIDGHYWDTALMGIALAESGVSLDRLRPTAQYLIQHRSENGGLPFGLDFENAPDTDDAAALILFLNHFGDEFKPQINQGFKYLKDLQNEDGGWGAFDRDNVGNIVLRALAKPFEDSADLFDESSADVTGHILESLGARGFRTDDPHVDRALTYLLKTKDTATGTWEGRWGVNRIYATSAVIVGALKVGVSPRSAWIRKAVNWLIEMQNPLVGCWGESIHSYVSRAAWGKGTCTASQTAWAVIALQAASHSDELSAKASLRGANWLAKAYSTEERTWSDAAPVGTGHPKVVYMNYPSYPKIFPLIALSRVFTVLKAD